MVSGVLICIILFSSAKIIFNKHLDHPPNVAGNMRMFESTGLEQLDN